MEMNYLILKKSIIDVSVGEKGFGEGIGDAHALLHNLPKISSEVNATTAVSSCSKLIN